MSERYPGGIISKTAPTVSTSGAPGVWTLEQQAAYQKAGTWPFGGPFTYIEDVFSTYLYTGNGTSTTVNNGIDTSTYGGLIWVKKRSDVQFNILQDTARGAGNILYSNATSASSYDAASVTTFTTTGFTTGSDSNVNESAATYASWSFRKQAKFFDVVTYTGDGTSGRTVAHNLGSVPGCIIVKRTDSTSDWIVYHTSLGNTSQLRLNVTNGVATGSTAWASTTPTSTSFYVGSTTTNTNGATYVAYLFAHNAGGFGTAGTDNVISCGSFTTDGSGFADINLGYEAQWALVKKSSSTGSWAITDNMRGWVTGAALNTSDDAVLFPNVANAETTQGRGYPTSTGFGYADSASSTYIYIAIRRGPMKTPTSGTSVFASSAWSATASVTTDTAPTFPVDLGFSKARAAASQNWDWQDRLRGATNALYSNLSDVETAEALSVTAFPNTGVTLGADSFAGYWNQPSARTFGHFFFGRAPFFMDVVCVTGTGSGATYNHNLGVVPELMFQKGRSLATSWESYTPLGKDYAGPKLDSSDAASVSSNYWTAPTSTTFKLQSGIDGNGYTYVVYLFASCPGVSKVGSYSGTGATQTISCGFAARFVMIKRTDSTGNWWVWDTARGMVAGTDPRLALNSTAVETNANWVYTNASGFQIVTTDATVNASGGSYIYLAIA